MKTLNFMTTALLLYAALVALSIVAASWVYGLHSVQGQMVIIFSLVAGVPGAFKLARGMTEIGA